MRNGVISTGMTIEVQALYLQAQLNFYGKEDSETIE
jgi:hypothetical protein